MSNSETTDSRKKKGPMPNVNGSWQSIIAWGHWNDLDEEQQTAYEIMTATYVLTFMEEAHHDTECNGEFQDQIDCLRKLSRKRPDDGSKPLRLFVTGPAGAGKCKFSRIKPWLC